MRLENATGKLAIFAGFKGFRKFVQAKANELHITGTIQRYHHYDIKLKLEGTLEQQMAFIDFLDECQDRGMISGIAEYVSREIRYRISRKFVILKDHSRLVDNNGKVHKGDYSDDPDYEKLSLYSADTRDR